MKIICVTSQLCWCFVCLKAVHSFEYGITYYYNDSRGGPDVSGEKSSPVASICRCVWEMLIRLIIQTWKQEGRCETDFVSVWNTIFLHAIIRLRGQVYFRHVPCSLQCIVWRSWDSNHCQDVMYFLFSSDHCPNGSRRLTLLSSHKVIIDFSTSSMLLWLCCVS